MVGGGGGAGVPKTGGFAFWVDDRGEENRRGWKDMKQQDERVLEVRGVVLTPMCPH